MRYRPSSLGLLLLLGAACSELIGLSDYEKVDASSGGAGLATSGGKDGAGGLARGGTAGSGNASGAGGLVGRGGIGDATEAGAAGDAGRAGEGGTAGATPTTGGASGEAGIINGEAGAAGFGGAAGASGAGNGGTTLGGTLGSGGNGGVSGTSGGGGLGGGGSGSGGVAGTGGVSTSGAGTSGSGSGGVAGTGGAGTSGAGTGGNGCTGNELLVDGSFEQITSPWSQLSDRGLRLIWSETVSGFPPHSGAHVVWLGGTCDDDGANCEDEEYLRQTVAVPLGTTQLRGSCWWQVETEDSETLEFDVAEVRLVNAANNPLFTFARVSNLDYNLTWESFSRVSTDTYAGQSITFEIHGSLDESADSHFWFDSCSLIATVCP